MADLAIAQPLTLKGGLTLSNRLVKASMAENIPATDGLPSQGLLRPYGEWAKGGWGMLLTGNVHVDPKHLGSPGAVTWNDHLEYATMLEAWKAWAAVCNARGTPALVQINHPGRQSPAGAGSRSFLAKAIAPSAVPLSLGPGLLPRLIRTLVFGTPREMTRADIDDVIARFAQMARLAADAGFAGVQIHAAHGYLLTQFLSESSNRRTDAYGGSPAARARIVLDIIRAVRAAVPEKGFTVGVKVNSADHQSPTELSACREQLKLIAEAGVDFLEISGGDYENPVMSVGTGVEVKKSARTLAREAFFLEFAATIRRDLPDIPLMVTGGFRTRQGADAAVREENCDLVGMARPAVVNPSLPKETILNPGVKDEDAVVHTEKSKPSWILSALGLNFTGAVSDTIYYGGLIAKLGTS